MSSLYGSEDQSEESSPEPQGPLDDQTNAPINADGPIVVDDFSDEDSEFSDNSDMTSLSSSVLEYEYENGRRYHSNRTGQYMMPNDEEEQDRMDLNTIKMATDDERRITQSSSHKSPKDPRPWNRNWHLGS
ncbi:Methyltransferase type 11 [Penicillium camemberti]|uniref:Methyltransferase type 11 n=1 Tax=Penicillium camemberti (strain FM 013) TaxID=1429867 RepID=A0A0G4PK67_PENC3|nr:Methyltransferase type 11 [Penicillium camemberti]